MTSKSLTDVPEQRHDAMRAASMRPVSGDAATAMQAAGGGLELPGREHPATEVPIVGIDQASEHEPIPGERDASTLTQRQPGSMSGAFNGEDLPSADLRGLMDERTIREHVREGGGVEAERRFVKKRNR